MPLQPPGSDLAGIFPDADRMQRAAFDWWACVRPMPRISAGGCGMAPGPGTYPLRRIFDAARVLAPEADSYSFVPVAGEGVHEIPVGPVHAGTIEPGHFRFSVVGERVLRLEERLGYVHKGIEKRFESLGVHEAGRLAGRVSGD
jgi:hypothetical protein